MPGYLRLAALTLAMTALGAGCSRDSQPDTGLTQDSALTRDLSLAGGDSAVQPELQDVPAAPTVAPPPLAEAPPPPPPRQRPTPVRPQSPRPSPAPPEISNAPVRSPTTTPGGNTAEKGPGTAEGSGMVAAGTTLNLDAVDKVCTNTNRIGDRFTAVVKEGVTGSNGAAIPAGALVTIELTELKRSDNSNDQIVMGFRVISVAFGGRTFALDADVQSAAIDRVRASSTGNDAKKVVGGAVVGAIIGKVLGKSNKGTLIGAAAGAAAGGAAAAATANYEGCVAAGADLVVRLNSAVTVTTP